MGQQGDRGVPRAIVPTMIVMFGIPFLPLLISGRWGWAEAWAYAIISILGLVVSRLLAVRRHPDIAAERARFVRPTNVAPWDKVLAPLVGIGSGLIPLVAGLDARFRWSAPFGGAAKVAALIAILAGYVIASYAMVENRFFSGMMRIQTNRDHRVVATGPYRWVRHPGYAGALLAYLATPVLLDAAWAFVPVVALGVAVGIRTRLEDRALQEDLPGYREYAARVRFRLVPGVW